MWPPKINESVLPFNGDEELQHTAEAVNMGLFFSPTNRDLSSFLLHMQSSIKKTFLGPATTQA